MEQQGSPASADMVVIGRIGKPHGVRGEFKVVVHNRGSDLWRSGMSVTWSLAGKPGRTLVLQALRETPKGLLARIDGITDRDEVQRLINGDLAVPRSHLPPTKEGEYYHVDIIGADVFDDASGELLGHVRRISQTNVDLLEIELLEGGEVLVPVVADYVLSIGEAPGRVVIRDLDHWKG